MAKRRTAAQIQASLKAVARDVAKGLTVGDSCRRPSLRHDFPFLGSRDPDRRLPFQLDQFSGSMPKSPLVLAGTKSSATLARASG